MPRTKAAVVSEFRRRQILEAARRVFSQHGLATATMQQIARAAGVAKGTLYLYYRSKDQILRQLLDDALQELYRETIPLIGEPGDYQTKLRTFLDGTLAFFDRHHDFLERCHFELTPEMRRQARRAVRRIFATQTRAWRSALEKPGRRRGLSLSPAEFACGIVSLAYGLSQMRLRGWTAGSREGAVAWSTALLLHGLARS